MVLYLIDERAWTILLLLINQMKTAQKYRIANLLFAQGWRKRTPPTKFDLRLPKYWMVVIDLLCIKWRHQKYPLKLFVCPLSIQIRIVIICAEFNDFTLIISPNEILGPL